MPIMIDDTSIQVLSLTAIIVYGGVPMLKVIYESIFGTTEERLIIAQQRAAAMAVFQEVPGK